MSDGIGKTVNRLRTEQGLSLQKLADATGLSKGHICDLENGNQTNPTIGSLYSIAAALKTDIAALLALPTPANSRADREKVAAMMIRNSIATGHGDTIDDLLGELKVHIRSANIRAETDERIVDAVIDFFVKHDMLDERDEYDLSDVMGALVDNYEPGSQPANSRVEVPEPVYKAVERILDDHSAWIERPHKEVTEKIALAATIAAHHIIEQTAFANSRAEPVAWKAIKRACVVFCEKFDKGPFDELSVDDQQRLLTGMRPVIEAAIPDNIGSEAIGAAKDALEAIDAEFCITGQCKDLLDAAIALLDKPQRDIRSDAIRECIAVVDARAKAYEMHLDKGKGQHGQLNYVRDITWDNWQGHFSEASQIATMLRALLQQEGE